MKIFFLLISVLPLMTFADQSKFLAIARDSYLQSLLNKIQEYCDTRRPDLPRDVNYVFICSLQINSDCSHGESEYKERACEAQERVTSLEKMVLKSDKNLSSLEHIPLARELIMPKPDPTWKPKHPLDQAPEPRWIQVKIPDVNTMTDEEWQRRGRPNKVKLQKAAQEWKAARDQVNALEVNQNCQTDDDCELQHYGGPGCAEGREGYFAVRKGSQSPQLLSALADYRKAQEQATKIWDHSYLCMAVVQYHSAVCNNQRCRSKVTNQKPIKASDQSSCEELKSQPLFWADGNGEYVGPPHCRKILGF